MKPFTVAITRDILDQYFREEISYSKMIELLNIRVHEYILSKTKCPHLNIEHITIKPTEGNTIQQEKTFFKCADCNEYLPIESFTVRIFEAPIYNTKE